MSDDLPPMWRWMTTNPNPRSPDTGFDASQRGWRLHLVDLNHADAHIYSKDKNQSPSLCGIRPRHGWGLDLFIDEPCARCSAKEVALGLDISLK
jgi:hypothetical protein